MTANPDKTLQIKKADIILAGAGLAGLTLALELVRRPAFRDRSILLIDRDSKLENDRTWCFWSTPEEVVPPVIYHSWARCRFFSPNREIDMHIAPFQYHMVRGRDFYAWAKDELRTYSNVRQIQTTITGLDFENGIVRTEMCDFQADYVFNSAFTPVRVLPEASRFYPQPPFSISGKPKTAPILPEQTRFDSLLQHFKGWLVKTRHPAFDPAVMTFMDFRIEQAGETRFVYVLPLTHNLALVEFTLFSPNLLEPAAYDAVLKNYLQQYLQIEDFRIVEEEFGVIPMTDFPFPHSREGRVIHIGTAAGFVKASSGYAFKRTQRKIRSLVDGWELRGEPDPADMRSRRIFRMFDSIFLNVLADQNHLGGAIFSSLFEKLPPALVLRFLDEDSTFVENLRLVSAPPTWPFVRALFKKMPVLPKV